MEVGGENGANLLDGTEHLAREVEAAFSTLEATRHADCDAAISVLDGPWEQLGLDSHPQRCCNKGKPIKDRMHLDTRCARTALTTGKSATLLDVALPRPDRLRPRLTRYCSQARPTAPCNVVVQWVEPLS